MSDANGRCAAVPSVQMFVLLRCPDQAKEYHHQQIELTLEREVCMILAPIFTEQMIVLDVSYRCRTLQLVARRCNERTGKATHFMARV